MSKNLKFQIVDGIKCYSYQDAKNYINYPDSGFELSDEDAGNSFWVKSRNRLFKKIVFSNALRKNKTKFLEIGCGTGAFIKEIVQNKNLQITGSEIYIKGLKIAKNNLPQVEFIQYDASAGYINKKYNLIASFDVLEHIDDDIAALLNINQMLKEKGRFVISVPQYMFLWSKLDELVMHKRRYSKKELIAKLKESGFNIVFSTSFLFTLFPLMFLQRLFDKEGKEQDLKKSEKHALEKRTKFPSILNHMLDFFMRIDEFFISIGISLPFGGTLIVIAEKKQG